MKWEQADRAERRLGDATVEVAKDLSQGKPKLKMEQSPARQVKSELDSILTSTDSRDERKRLLAELLEKHGRGNVPDPLEPHEPPPVPRHEEDDTAKKLAEQYGAAMETALDTEEKSEDVGKPFRDYQKAMAGALPEFQEVEATKQYEQKLTVEEREAKLATKKAQKKSFDADFETTKTRMGEKEKSYFDALEREQGKRFFAGAILERAGIFKNPQAHMSAETRRLHDAWVRARAAHAENMLGSLEGRRQGRGGKARQERNINAVKERYQRRYVIKEAVLGAEAKEQRIRAEALAARDKKAGHIIEYLSRKYQQLPAQYKAIPSVATLGVAAVFGAAPLAVGVGALNASAASLNFLAERARKRGDHGEAEVYSKFARNMTAGGWGAKFGRSLSEWMNAGKVKTAAGELEDRDEKKGNFRALRDAKDQHIDLGNVETFAQYATTRQRAAADIERARRLQATGAAAGGLAASAALGAAEGGFMHLASHTGQSVEVPIPHGHVALPLHHEVVHGGHPHEASPTAPPHAVGQAVGKAEGALYHAPAHGAAHAPEHAPPPVHHTQTPPAAVHPQPPHQPEAPKHHEVTTSMDQLKHGEGADHLFRDLESRLRGEYPKGDYPPVVQKLFAYHGNFDKLAYDTKFEWAPGHHGSTIMHASGHGRSADAFSLSADGKTLSYIDTKGIHHTLMQETPQHEVVVFSKDNPGQGNYDSGPVPHQAPEAAHHESTAAAPLAHEPKHHAPVPHHGHAHKSHEQTTPASSAPQAVPSHEAPLPPPAPSAPHPTAAHEGGVMSMEEYNRTHSVEAGAQAISSAPHPYAPDHVADLGVYLREQYPQLLPVHGLQIDTSTPHIYQDARGEYYAFGGKTYADLHRYAELYAQSQNKPIVVHVEGNPHTVPGFGLRRWMTDTVGDGQGHATTPDQVVDQARQLGADGMGRAPDPYTFTRLVQ